MSETLIPRMCDQVADDDTEPEPLAPPKKPVRNAGSKVAAFLIENTELRPPRDGRGRILVIRSLPQPAERQELIAAALGEVADWDRPNLQHFCERVDTHVNPADITDLHTDMLRIIAADQTSQPTA